MRRGRGWPVDALSAPQDQTSLVGYFVACARVLPWRISSWPADHVVAEHG